MDNEKIIIFATGNAHKMIEIREILSGINAKILSQKEAGINIDIVEDGETFEENALIKAREVAKVAHSTEKFANAIVLADDSGLVIDYLNGEPGIYSARYMGEDTSYEIKNSALIKRLEGVTGKERSARFVCAVAAVFSDGSSEVVRETMEGQINTEIKGENGFGYDPILYLPKYKKTSAEISREEKNEISHRGKALRAMLTVLRNR